MALAVCLSAFVLALVGLYAVVAHRTAERRREIGLRIALGARSTVVARFVIDQVRTALVAGVLLGVSGALAWERAFAPERPDGARLVNPVVLGVAGGALVVIVVLGCAASLRRAVADSPADVLREG
jgi:ABC-type antimicrobial peptide transport system permease subunit